VKKLTQALMLLAAAASLSTCALFSAARSGNIAGAADAAKGDALAGAQKLADAKSKADADCAKVEAKVVSWPEERAIGGAMSIGMGTKGKGLYIEITDKDPKVLKEKVDKAGGKRDAVKLSASEKNDLNAYIQVVGEHVAAGSSRPGIAWTFGVIDDPTVNAFSTPGGYVFVTTGLLSLIDNEAQLAGVLGHEIGHITAKHAIKTYQAGKVGACKVAVTGFYLVEAGASNVPGGEEFVANAKFGKTLKKFADPDGLDMDKDPDVDKDFMVWFTNRVIDFNNMKGNAKEDEFDADRISYELMAAAGYETKQLDKFIEKIPGTPGAFANHPSNKDRIEALSKIRGEGGFGADGGKAPALLSSVKWPKKQS
jgi:hypothetical protein